MPATDPARDIPRHLAIVMDGNGRWAQQRHRPRSFGHDSGQQAVRDTVEFCLRQGIGALTVFAFSSENWRRPESEVNSLLQLFVRALEKETDKLDEQDVRVDFIGDVDAFDDPLREHMRKTQQRTCNNTSLRFNVAVNYGGRWDIVNAARQLAESVRRGELLPDEITESELAARTCLADQPPPDLFIRTGGDCRISNFLLWQLAYTELYFTDTLWPDIDTACLQSAVDDYACRQRRFGGTSAPAVTGTSET